MSEELRRGIPIPTPIGEKVEYTKEEKEKHDRDFEKILKEYGVLKENQFISGGKVITKG